MQKQRSPRKNVNQVVRINFEKQSLEIPFDKELLEFVRQLEPDTAKDEDIHVLGSYFQIYWPVKAINPKANTPQLYKSFFVK